MLDACKIGDLLKLRQLFDATGLQKNNLQLSLGGCPKLTWLHLCQRQASSYIHHDLHGCEV
jgi:hypothetical protein